MAHGRREVTFKISTLRFFPAHLDTLRLMGRYMEGVMIATGTRKSTMSTWETNSDSILCTITALSSKMSMVSIESEEPRL